MDARADRRRMCGNAEGLGLLRNRCRSTVVVLVLILLGHRTSWELATQHGAHTCFHQKHRVSEDLEKAFLRAIDFGEGRGPIDINNRFPAFLAVIGTHQNTIITAGQAYEFLNRMLTEGFALMFPLRMDLFGMGLCHMRSMWESGFKLTG